MTGMSVDGREYYRSNYSSYERQNSARKIDFYMSLLQKWAPKGSHVHELGVGLGLFLARASRDYQCSGSDVNQFGVAETRRRSPELSVFHGSVEQIPTRPSTDVVVAWDVLEHIPEIGPALDVVCDRLPRGGVLIGVVPVYDGPLGWVVTLLDKDPTHVSKWPRKEWLTTLREHGFSVVESGGIIRRLVFRRFYLHLTRPQFIMRHAGSALWFVARKP